MSFIPPGLRKPRETEGQQVGVLDFKVGKN